MTGADDKGVAAYGVDGDARGVQALQRPPRSPDVRIVDRIRGHVRKRPSGRSAPVMGSVLNIVLHI